MGEKKVVVEIKLVRNSMKKIHSIRDWVDTNVETHSDPPAASSQALEVNLIIPDQTQFNLQTTLFS